MRAALEERQKGWIRLKYSGHRDRVDLRILDSFWHSDYATTEDNQNKHAYRIYHPADPNTSEVAYDLNWRRAQERTDKDTLKIFRGSTFASELKRATATAKRPQGVEVGRKLLVRCNA